MLSSVPQALDISLDNLDSNVQFWTQEVFTQPVVYKSGHKDQSKENSGFAAPVVGIRIGCRGMPGCGVRVQRMLRLDGFLSGWER